MKVVALQNNRNANECLAKLPNGVIGFFGEDSGVYPGQEVEVMITGAGKNIRPDGYPKVVFLQVVNRDIHHMVPLAGFNCAGSMCTTTSYFLYPEDYRKFHFSASYATPGRVPVYVADNVDKAFYNLQREPLVSLIGWVQQRPAKPLLLVGLNTLESLHTVVRANNMQVKAALSHNKTLRELRDTVRVARLENNHG